MNDHALIALAAIGLIALVCQYLAWWVKLPAILFLLLAGIVVGPVIGWIDPTALFGGLLLPMISLSVAVILFEGSLTLKLDEIRGLEQVVRNLVSVGIAVTWGVTAAATHWLLAFPWPLALLFGAVTVVTGPTVIVPMLRTVRPTARLANILRWEGIVIDPVGALLAVLVFEFIASGQGGGAFSHTLAAFGKIIAAGVASGAIAGYALGEMLRRFWLPEYLHNVATLTLVFGVFAAANTLQPEAGLLAVTVMGILLANMKNVAVDRILDFKESLSLLLISGLFILLAAGIQPTQIQSLGWGALGVFAAIQFVARPLKVLVSTWGSALSWRERALLAWIAPRGIVAAATAALFSLRLQEAGNAQADLLVPLTFLVIIATVALQSATARWLARLLKVAEPEPRGFLIIGANPLARAVAHALQQHDYHALLADAYWENIRAARMEGLATFYGNPVSEHADRHLDLVGIGRMLALAPQGELNALASLRYRAEFGPGAVYTLQTAAEAETEKRRISSRHRGRPLFSTDATFSKLASLLSQGGKIRATHLTETFDFHAYQEKLGHKAIPLMALDAKERLRLFVADGELTPGAEWTVISLVPADALPENEPTPDSGMQAASPA